MAACLALASAGSRMAASMAMMAITTSSSINVNAFVLGAFCRFIYSVRSPAGRQAWRPAGNVVYPYFGPTNRKYRLPGPMV